MIEKSESILIWEDLQGLSVSHFCDDCLSCDEIFSFTRDGAGYLRRVVRLKKHIRKLKLDDIHIPLNTYNLHSFLNKRKKVGGLWASMVSYEKKVVKLCVLEMLTLRGTLAY